MEHKGFNVKLNKASTMYSIHMIGKGALPKTLQGLFTTVVRACEEINRYLDTKESAKE